MFHPTRFFFLVGGILLPFVACAHSVLNQDMRHDITLVVGPEYLDVTVQLTLTNKPAAALRKAMDTSGDGVIGRGERRVPIPGIILADGPLLTVDGEPVALMTFYRPRIDLLEEGAVRVRLAFFACMPEAVGKCFEVRLEDRFFEKEGALLTFSATGRESIGVEVSGARSKRFLPHATRVLIARCTVETGKKGTFFHREMKKEAPAGSHHPVSTRPGPHNGGTP